MYLGGSFHGGVARCQVRKSAVGGWEFTSGMRLAGSRLHDPGRNGLKGSDKTM